MTTFQPNTEASPRHRLTAASRQNQGVGIRLAFAVIGGKQDDVPIKPIAYGATRETLVAQEKEKARARAKAKARVVEF